MGNRPGHRLASEYRTFLKVAKVDTQEMTSKILEDAYDYYEGISPNDDVTLVNIKQG